MYNAVQKIQYSTFELQVTGRVNCETIMVLNKEPFNMLSQDHERRHCFFNKNICICIKKLSLGHHHQKWGREICWWRKKLIAMHWGKSQAELNHLFAFCSPCTILLFTVIIIVVYHQLSSSREFLKLISTSSWYEYQKNHQNVPPFATVYYAGNSCQRSYKLFSTFI